MNYIFVVTYGRSGSTVLLSLLNTIEGYCIRGENGGIIHLLADAVHRVNKAHHEFGPTNTKLTSPWYGINDVSPDDWKTAIADGFEKHILRPPADTQTIGFKDIRYTPLHQDEDVFDATIDFLVGAFPNARIIFNTRDWRQVAKSGWWKTYRPSKVRKVITGSDKRFHDANERLGDRAFLIDYSDYSGNPDGFLPMLEWLGEELPAETLESICGNQLRHMNYWHPKMTLRQRLNKAIPW